MTTCRILWCFAGALLIASGAVAQEAVRIRFDALDGVRAAKGYGASDARCQLDSDKSEGLSSVRLSFAAGANGYGVAQIEVDVPVFDATGKGFEVSFKPLDKLHGYWGVELYDENCKLAEQHRMFYANVNQWNTLEFKQGRCTPNGWFERGAGNIARIKTVVSRAQTLDKAQQAAVLWDDFHEFVRGVAKSLPGATLPVGEPPQPGGQRLNVADVRFGADPIDNDKDDSAAVTAAIAAGGEGPFTLYFPAGVYNIANSILLQNKHGVSIAGDGPGKTVIKRVGPYWRAGVAQTYENLISTDPEIFVIRNCSDICVRDVSFDANGCPTFGGVGWHDSARRVAISHTRFFDSHTQPPLSNHDRYSYVLSGYPDKVEDVWITDNVIDDLQLEVDHAKRVLIERNIVRRPVCSVGIGLVSGGFQPGQDGGTAQDYTVRNNLVSNPDVLHMGLITCQLDPPDNNKSVFRNIDILNNVLVYDHDASNPSPAIKLGTGGPMVATAGNRFENIRIEGNRIFHNPGCKFSTTNFPGYIFANGLLGDYRYQSVVVQNNTLYTGGSATDYVVFYREGSGCGFQNNIVRAWEAPPKDGR